MYKYAVRLYDDELHEQMLAEGFEWDEEYGGYVLRIPDNDE